MKRPGILGFFLVAVFGLVFAIELRTLLVMLSIEIPADVYYPGALAVVAIILLAMLALPAEDDSGNPSEPAPTAD